MTTVLKLGGSVLTVKDEPETVDRETLRHAASAIAGTDDLVVVHGGGSFGHPHAAAYGVSRSEGTHDATAVRSIHGAMKRLNDVVVQEFADSGGNAVPVHPFSFVARDADGRLSFSSGPISTMLEAGFLPVTHGDVVVHAGTGASILSGDELVVALADALGADRVGVCSTVPGVLDDEGAVIDRIGRFEAVADVLGGSDATDVTGGMAAKVRELLELETPAFVFGVEDLAAFVEGGSPGTRIE